jgi:TolB-like protein
VRRPVYIDGLRVTSAPGSHGTRIPALQPEEVSMRTLSTALAAMLLVLSPSGAPAQQATPAGNPQRVLVAVFPLSGFWYGNAAQQRDLADAFRSMVISEMSGANLQMVERERIDRLLEAQNISLTGGVTDAQAIQIGEMLGAQYAVSGSINVVGPEARLDLRFIDIETSEIPHTFKQSTRPDRVLSLANRVASDFAGKARLTQRVAEVRVPVSASLAYSQGLDFERRGRRHDAARMYRKTLELFPQHPHARAALQRVN